MSLVIRKARNLRNSRQQKKEEESFWVQNLISFAKPQYNYLWNYCMGKKNIFFSLIAGFESLALLI